MQPLRGIFLREGALTVGIAPECGGALTRFDMRVGDSLIDVLRPALDQSIRGVCALGSSCFPLVPYGGRLREGRFRFGGNEYRYPLNAAPERHSSHGDGWTRPWDLLHLNRRTAIMRLPADDSAPLQYVCTQSISVDSERVRIVLSSRNVSAQPIPMGLGLHPYFANRTQAALTVALPDHWQWDHELMPVAKQTNPLAEALARGRNVAGLPIAAEYAGWDGRALIEWRASGLRVDLVTTPRLRHVVMWLPEGESFFCLEPISHATDALNEYSGSAAAEDFVILGPGETMSQCFDFNVSTH
jgi:aldose 1-epimerase